MKGDIQFDWKHQVAAERYWYLRVGEIIGQTVHLNYAELWWLKCLQGCFAPPVGELVRLNPKIVF